MIEMLASKHASNNALDNTPAKDSNGLWYGLVFSIVALMIWSLPSFGLASDCGGSGQKQCTPEAVAGKAVGEPNCPAGSRYHQSGGGACWTCPEGTTLGPGNDASPGTCLRERGIMRQAALILRRPPVCPKGSVFDVLANACFSCPGDSKRTLLPLDGPQSCHNTVTLTYASAQNFGLPTCPDDGIVDLKSKQCYRCPAGFERDPAMDVNAIDACVKVLYVKSLPQKSGSVACPAGAQAAGKACVKCPKGTIVNASTGQCERPPCQSGLSPNQNGVCR